MQELKRCPFCGGESVLLNSSREIPEESVVFWVYCKNCSATSMTYDKREEAIECWNTRTPGWIPVEERLPKESEEFNDVYDPATLAVIDTEWHEKSDIVQVTVYDRDEEKYFTYVDNTYNGEWVTFNLDNFKVIAWKPLSDPYRPEPLETRKELERAVENDTRRNWRE